MDTDVLVVGAGPTGLITALVLARCGVDVQIIDAAPQPSDKSRALAVQARTLELLERLGLAEPLRRIGHVLPATNFHVDGRAILRVDLRARMPTDSAFEMLFVSQAEVEALLRRALGGCGIDVQRGRRLIALQQHPDHLIAALEDGSLKASWIVGADGAHSTVRHELGLSFDGAPYPSDFLLGDVVLDADVDTDELHVFLARAGIAALFPMPGTHTRVIATDPSPTGGALGLDELAEKANAMAGRSWSLSDPRWLARFRLHHRSVPAYRHGRAFVAGDAAHIHSPLGGQGMNTGLQDGFNLAWKLAMVLRHGLDEALLDTYHAERHPVGQRLLAFTDRGFSLATEDNQLVTGLRNLVLPWLAPAVATEARQATVVRFVSQLGIRYRSTALQGEADGASPEPGDRLEDPRATGLSWSLLASGDDPLWRARVEAFAGMFGWLQLSWGPPGPGLDGPGLLLIRPDGHLAIRTVGEHLDPVARFLRGLGCVPVG